MSNTYRNGGDGTLRSDGGRNYATPRYRPGSRRKPLRITAIGVYNEAPDVERLGRAIARVALNDKGECVLPYPENERGSDGDA